MSGTIKYSYYKTKGKQPARGMRNKRKKLMAEKREEEARIQRNLHRKKKPDEDENRYAKYERADRLEREEKRNRDNQDKRDKRKFKRTTNIESAFEALEKGN